MDPIEMEVSVSCAIALRNPPTGIVLRIAFCSTKQQDIHLHFQLPLWVSPSQIEITAIIGNHFIVKVKGARGA